MNLRISLETCSPVVMKGMIKTGVKYNNIVMFLISVVYGRQCELVAVGADLKS